MQNSFIVYLFESLASSCKFIIRYNYCNDKWRSRKCEHRRQNTLIGSVRWGGKMCIQIEMKICIPFERSVQEFEHISKRVWLFVICMRLFFFPHFPGCTRQVCTTTYILYYHYYYYYFFPISSIGSFTKTVWLLLGTTRLTRYFSLPTQQAHIHTH